MAGDANLVGIIAADVGCAAIMIDHREPWIVRVLMAGRAQVIQVGGVEHFERDLRVLQVHGLEVSWQSPQV